MQESAAAWLAPAAVFAARGVWIALPLAAAFGVLSARAFVAADVGKESAEDLDTPAVGTLGVLAPSPAATQRRIAAQVAAAAAYGAAFLAVLDWIAAAAAMTGIACAVPLNLLSAPIDELKKSAG